jgi:MFS family permease
LREGASFLPAAQWRGWRIARAIGGPLTESESQHDGGDGAVRLADLTAARRGRLGYPREFWVVFWATFALNLSSNMFVLFPLFLVELGAGATTIGAVVGTFSLAALVARPGCGVLLDRAGRRNTATWLLALDAGVVALYLAVHGLGWPIYAVRALHGLVEGTARVALFAMVYELMPAERAGQAMSLFSLCGMGSAGIAPLVAECLIRRWGFIAFFIVSIALTAIASAGARLLPDDRVIGHEPAAQGQGPGYADLLKDGTLVPLWIATLLFALALSSRLSFVAPFAYQQGVREVGLYFTIYAAAAVVIRTVGARLIDRVGLERMVAPSLVTLGVGLALIAATGHAAMLDIAAVIGGVGHGYVYPAITALVIRRTRLEAAGRSSTIYSSLYDLGSMAGPYLLGVIAHLAGYPAMFVVAGAMAAAAAIYFVAVEPSSIKRRLA